MIIADLKQPCTACKGSGFQAGFNEYGSLRPNLSGKCLTCGGSGYRLTELGRELWELYQPRIRDLIRQELDRQCKDLNASLREWVQQEIQEHLEDET